MTKYFLGCFFSIFSMAAFSQTNKLPSDTSYLDDYSNYKKDFSKTPSLKSYKSFNMESYQSVVIVNGKIYDPKSTAFRSIPTEELYLEKTYADSASTSDVKYVYIFRHMREREFKVGKSNSLNKNAALANQ